MTGVQTCALPIYNVTVAKFLIAHGADVNNTREKPRSVPPLIWACDYHDPDLIRLMLEKGADANRAAPTGRTPLMDAASKGDVEIVQLLLSHGADVATKSNEGATALREAKRKGHQDIADLLIKAGAKE